jgi:hypothetical protein
MTLCIFLNMCVANPESSLLYLMFLTCSFYPVLSGRPVCPRYDFWQSKHVLLYIPLYSYLLVVCVFFKYVSYRACYFEGPFYVRVFLIV